jgi:endonuclease YncB( thermonuclease family)
VNVLKGNRLKDRIVTSKISTNFFPARLPRELAHSWIPFMHTIISFHMLAAVLFLVCSIPSLCCAWSGKVVSVSDGDTIKALHNGKVEKIRLYGIDTPEMDQSFGQAAKNLTSALVAGREIQVEPKYIDSSKRTVGLVYVDGNLLNELIVMNGYAWVYQMYCKEGFCADWNKLENEARKQRKGMWKDANNIPPWQWRHQGERDVAKAASHRNPTRQTAKATSRKHQTAGRFRCDGRTYCSQMTSCQEATFFIQNCPGTKMDGNRDGIPCERQWCR